MNPTAAKCLAPKHNLVNTTVSVASLQFCNASQQTPLMQPVSMSTPAVGDSQTRPAQPYGKMLSPLYRKKLEEIDADFDSSVLRTSQKDRYRKENETTIEVKWWNEVRI